MAMAEMDVDPPSVDLPMLAAAASDFSAYPGQLSDTAAQNFLTKFPLPVLLGALQAGSDVPGLETSVVTSLERVFKTNYGRSLLPHTLQYAAAGLTAPSPLVRKLTCVAIATLLENSGKDRGAVQAVQESHVTGPLLLAIGDSDASVAKAASDALAKLARTPEGLELIFTDKGAGVGQLTELTKNPSAVIRIRALSLAEAIFGVSDAAGVAVQESGVFNVLAAELDNSDDMLAQLNALELLCDLASTPHGARFLLAGSLIGRLTSTICNQGLDPLVRSQAMTVAARLTALYDASSVSPMSGSDAMGIIRAFGELLGYLERVEESGPIADGTEHENALDALALIGKTQNGAELLFDPHTLVGRHVMNAAFLNRGVGVKLAGIHALATIAGSERTPESLLLRDDVEVQMKDMIYAAAGERSPTRTPAGMFLIFFRQSPDVRLAMYRLTTPMLARLWCLRELCGSRDLIDFLLDPRLENKKEAMEWRHVCCVAMTTALSSAIQRGELPKTETLSRLEEFVRKGPFQSKDGSKGAIPIYATQERM
jgi:26S proteasome non-ATPase regulatory subunit 5